MKKLSFIILFLLAGIMGCKKEETEDDGYVCRTCTTIQKYYSAGVLVNTITNVSTYCANDADYQTYLQNNNHSDTSLVQTCNCQ
jgi:hypothetical protein